MHMVKRVTEVRESECSVICLNIVKPHFYVLVMCYYKVLN